LEITVKKYLLLLIFICISQLKSQNLLWQESNGPYGCAVSSILSDSVGHLIINEDSLLFLSTDSGLTWKKTGLGGGNLVIDHNGYLYTSWMARSTDFGSSWNDLIQQYYGLEIRGSGICQNGNLIAYTYDYFGSSGKIWISSNDGNSWFNGEPNEALESSDQFIDVFRSNISGYVFGVSRFFGNIFRSSDNGLNWTQLNINFGLDSIKCVSIKNDGNLYLGRIGGIVHSTDYGETWLPYELENETINCLHISSEGNIYAGSSKSGIFKSSDNGYTWFPVNNGIVNYEIIALGEINNILFAGTNGNGLYRSSDNGLTWNLSKSVPLSGTTSITICSDSTFLAATNFGVFRSSDQGVSWKHINDAFLMNSAVTSLTTAANGYVYAAVPFKGLFRSTDNGQNWTEISHPPYVEYLKLVAAGKHNQILCSAWEGVFSSSNYGESWEKVLNAFEVQAIAFHPNGHIYVAEGMFGGFIYRSTDNGQTWDTLSSFVFGGISQFAFEGRNVFAAYRHYGQGSCIIQSTDFGFTWYWDYNKQLLPGNNVGTSILIPRPGHLYLGTADVGIFFTTDYGYSWIDYNDNNNKIINCLAIDSQGRLCAGTAKGVYFTNLSVTSIGSGFKSSPTSFSLSQNYPNPFNPTTFIRYSIPNASFVNLKVYDILGRETTTLINEEKPAGNYEVEFNGEDLSSGIYFYKLQTEDFTYVKKMIMVK